MGRTKAVEETQAGSGDKSGKRTKGAKFKQEGRDASAGPGEIYKYLEGNKLWRERKAYSLSPQM